MTPSTMLNRRAWLASGAAASLAAAGRSFAQTETALRKGGDVRRKNKLCAFVKFLQAMDNDRLAATISQLGFDGIEATVRDKGQVLPERVADDLPPLVEALARHDLEIIVMASGVHRVDQPHTEKVLRTAAEQGVKMYRMAYYRYQPDRPILAQLDELRPALAELAALNRELGMTAVYQNHSGNRVVGASVWDLRYLLQDIETRDIGVAFDIRHATVEGGLAWPVDFRVVEPHLGAVYIKDFVWEGRRPRNVPLGKGQVDPEFFRQLRRSSFDGPISLHVEYLPDAGLKANTVALENDLQTLLAKLD